MTVHFETQEYATALNAQGDYAVDGGFIYAWTGSHWSVIERAARAFMTLAKWLVQNGLHSSSKGELVPAALQTIIVACEMLYPGSIHSPLLSGEQQ